MAITSEETATTGKRLIVGTLALVVAYFVWRRIR